MSTSSKSLKTADNKGCVIIFIKAPEKGTVKTRLAASLGDVPVLALYKAFVSDLMKMLKKGRYPLQISFYPPDAGAKIEKWLGRSYHLTSQRGDDLGERMMNSFREAFFQGFQSAVLIGSDTPDLPCSIIDEAFLSLKDHDAVIGPSIDGGYYLIGFRRETFLPATFEGIPWSTAEVFWKTTEILCDKQYRVHILPELRDIDTLHDLRIFFDEHKGKDFTESATMKYLLENKGESL
jgi:rSAM/selenodomain-associated transferase 1